MSGGAYSTGMLIAGRAVQGVGGGGIILMIEMIVCDLVPLRERGAAIGIIFAVFALGSSMGPFIAVSSPRESLGDGSSGLTSPLPPSRLYC